VLVFTHGAGLDRELWAPCTAGRPVGDHLLWDVPVDPSLDRLATNLLDRVRQAANGCDVIHVGHSSGGDIVQRALMLDPGHARGAVLVGSLPIGGHRSRGARLSARLAPWRIRLGSLRRFRDQALATIAYTPHAQAYARACFAARSRTELADTWRAIADGVRLPQPFRPPCPLLLVIGEHDQTGGGYLRQAMTAWAESEPAADLVVIPGSAHVPSLDNPRAFMAQVDAFADRCVRRQSNR